MAASDIRPRRCTTLGAKPFCVLVLLAGATLVGPASSAPLFLPPVAVFNITPSDAAPLDHFGASVAVDLNTLVIGAPGDNIGPATNRGSAYVFIKLGATWQFQTKLLAPDGETGDQFGSTVAFDDNTAVIGAPLRNVAVTGGTHTDAGKVYVFARSGTTWGLQAELTKPGGADGGDQFGYAVSIDGNRIVVGAPFAQPPIPFPCTVPCPDSCLYSEDMGTAHVFRRTGTSWSEEEAFCIKGGPPLSGARLGSSVAIKDDLVVLGAPYYDVVTSSGVTITDAGAAFYSVRSSVGGWDTLKNVTAIDAEVGDHFGASVGAGLLRAVVGAPDNNVLSPTFTSLTDAGSAYAYSQSGSSLVSPIQIKARDGGILAKFGTSVALQGENIVVGAPGASPVFSNSGAASLFTGALSAGYVEYGALLPVTGSAGDKFGHSVAVAEFDDVVLVGAPIDDTAAGSEAGSVYLFELKPN